MTTPTSPSAKPWEHAKGGGAGSAADPLAARFVESLSVDTRLYDADIRGSTAHARMLAKVGLVSAAELQEIERGLAEIRRQIETAPAGPTAVGIPGAWPGWRTELEDVHMCVEAALIEIVGDPGRKLHTGRSRNDQVALDLRLWLRDAARVTGAAVDRVLVAFEGLARRQGDGVIAGYTHVQRAQPVTVGGEAMAWHTMFKRDRDDLAAFARGGTLRGVDGWESPLGSGALAGSSLPLDRAASAAALGMTRVSPSSMDATASRDEALDYLYLLSRTAMHLSRLAEQWVLYCSTEFGTLILADAHTTGSSMMPQKRNPDMLELIRGRCGAAYSGLIGLLTVMKGGPIGYNRDMQEDKRHVFGAHDVVLDSIEMAARVVAGATFRPPAGADLSRGFADATSLAEYLVGAGVPFRTAHQVVGGLVRDAEHRGDADFARLSVDDLQSAVRGAGSSATVDGNFADWLGAANVVNRYRSSGNAGVSGYRAALEGALRERGARDLSPAPPLMAAAASAPAPAPARASAPASAQTSTPPTSHPAESGAASAFAALFDVGPGGPEGVAESDRALIAAYEAVGRTLDDLPYTEEFERLFAQAHAHNAKLTRRDAFHRLHTIRKRGDLAKVGRSPAQPPKIEPAEESALAGLVVGAVGTLGQRDQLPYSSQFDALVERFNAQTGRQLPPHTVWRLVAKLAK
jgi:argininosuccinate lyase